MKLEKLLADKTGIELAIFAAGSAKALSKATGINHGVLCLWNKCRSVPVCSHDEMVKIEQATGIDRKRLCPDQYYHEDTTNLDAVFADKSAIEVACFIVGGKKKMALMLGISPPTITNWLKIRQINENHIAYLPYVEQMTGIDKAELCPSLFADDISSKLNDEDLDAF